MCGQRLSELLIGKTREVLRKLREKRIHLKLLCSWDYGVTYCRSYVPRFTRRRYAPELVQTSACLRRRLLASSPDEIAGGEVVYPAHRDAILVPPGRRCALDEAALNIGMLNKIRDGRP